jgi:predicted amidohydrolase YtcJ
MRYADLLLTGGNLITLSQRNFGAAAASRPSAMAFIDGRIAAVGNDEQMKVWAGPQTERMSLNGKTVVPGFIDSHIHLYWFGSQLLRQADLVGSASVDDVLGRISALAKRRPEGWLQGHGFDHDKLRERRFPTRADLDRVSTKQPIVISRVCGHAIVANSAAVALLSLAERAMGDEQSGLYTEDAGWAIYKKIPELREEEMEEAILAAANVALATGITTVETMLDTPQQMIGYSRLHRAGKLPLRVVAMPPHRAIEELHRNGVRTGTGDEWLKFGACKLFSDGSLGAQTAWLAEPYADKPDTRGMRIYPPQVLKEKVRDGQEKGFQVAIHAIGDEALRETIDAIEYVLDGESNEGHRHRVEHASVCPPDCLERLVQSEIVVTIQPQFVTSDTWTAQRLGPTRSRWAYPFKTMLDAGVKIALSSDCPVERLDAFAAIASAVERHEWSPDEKLSPIQAIYAYCMGSAYAGFLEDQLGSLEVGKRADFVVLSGDPTNMKAHQIRELQAEQVFIDGRQVHANIATKA